MKRGPPDSLPGSKKVNQVRIPLTIPNPPPPYPPPPPHFYSSPGNMYKIGPAGSRQGMEWDLKGQTQIVQILVSYGDCITSIRFQYLQNGRLVMSPIFGCAAFFSPGFRAVKLDPQEYIVGIDGQCGTRVEELTIHTSKTSYRFCGWQINYDHKKRFEYSFGPDNQFGGFHGTYESCGLKSIGVYFKPITTLGSTIGNTGNQHGGTSRGRSPSEDDLSASEEEYC